MSSPAQAVQVVKKPSKFPLILGLVLALAGGGGGFAATYLGLLDSLLGGGAHESPSTTDTPRTVGPTSSGITFVPMDPITINLGPRSDSRHLRFSAQLEVPSAQAAEVQRLMPRIVDVLNIYLRALDPHEIEEPAALLRLRGQMLRRVRIVTGPAAVNDLLVIEFVFN
jgi:flagellar FliL protein